MRYLNRLMRQVVVSVLEDLQQFIIIYRSEMTDQLAT